MFRGLGCGQDFNANSFSLVGTLTEICVWPWTKQSTQFKHFSECFLANTVHFVMFEYFVNHCDLKWFYSPVHLWLLLLFFFSTVLIMEGNYSNSCMCCQALPVYVQVGLFYCWPSCYCIYCICMAVSNQIKCFNRKML